MVRVQDRDNTVYEYHDGEHKEGEPTPAELYDRAVQHGLPAWEYDSDGYCIRNTLGIPCTPNPKAPKG